MKPIHFALVIFTVATMMAATACSTHDTSNAENLTWTPAARAIQEGIVEAPKDILIASLLYHPMAEKKLTLQSVERGTGAEPKPGVVRQGNWSATTETPEGQKLWSLSFALPIPVHSPAEDEEAHDDQDTDEPRAITLSLPWHDKAARLVVRDPEGAIVAMSDVAALPARTIAPQYLVAEGAERLAPHLRPTAQSRSAQLNDRPMAGSNRKIDIAFVPDGYKSMAHFRKDVNEIADFMLSIEPFRSRKEDFRFHYVNNLKDLGCKTAAKKLTYCKVSPTKLLLDAGVPFDNANVLVEGAKGGGVTFGWGTIGMAITSTSMRMKLVAAHEYGHAIGELWDEYVARGKTKLTNTFRSNCYDGLPAAPEWTGLVAFSDYAKGCFFSNAYRPSITSLMNAGRADYFNGPSIRLLNEAFDRLTLKKTQPCQRLRPELEETPLAMGVKPRARAEAAYSFHVANGENDDYCTDPTVVKLELEDSEGADAVAEVTQATLKVGHVTKFDVKIRALDGMTEGRHVVNAIVTSDAGAAYRRVKPLILTVDRTPPRKPEGLTLVNKQMWGTGANHVTYARFSYRAARDNFGPEGMTYVLEVDGVPVTESGLLLGYVYVHGESKKFVNVTVRAKDAAGNLSAPSESVKLPVL